MKGLLCSVSLLLASFLSFAQSGNLVRNGGFEEVFSIGGGTIVGVGIDAIFYWYSPNYGSPDLFHVFSQDTLNLSIPKNGIGFQVTNGGNAYAGIALYVRNSGYVNYREYIEGELTSKLLKDSLYVMEMYLNLADTSRFAINRFGISFNKTQTHQIDDKVIYDVPKISFDTGLYFSDTVNWVRFCKTFVATGDEEYFIIGNFYDDSLTSVIEIRDSTGPHANKNMCYMLIDDVSLYQLNSKDTSRVCKNDTVYINHKPITLPGLYYDSICDIGLPHYVFWAEDTSEQTLLHPYGQPVNVYGSNYSGDTTLYFQLQTVNLACDSFHKVILVSETNTGMLPVVQSLVVNGTWQIQNLQANDEVELYDALGQRVHDVLSATYDMRVDVGTLASGVYYYSIVRSGKNIKHGKVCVQR